MSNLGTFTRTNNNPDVINLTLPNTGQDGQQGINAQYNIFENRFYGGDVYIHYKTNIPFGGWSMHNIEAVGYNYGRTQPIRCNWVFHVSYGNGFYQTELSNIYSGLAANRLYNSGDGYVVFVASSNTMYYAGWSINAYSLNPTGPFDVSILAVAQSSSNANVY
jgi:hypothetical protein